MLLLTELKSDPTTNSVQERSTLVKCGFCFFSSQLQVAHSGCGDSQGIKFLEMKQFLCILCRFCHGETSFLGGTNRNVAINTG